MVKQMKPPVINKRQLDGLPPPAVEGKNQQTMFDERQELTNLKNAAKKEEDEDDEDEDDDEEDYDEEDEEKPKPSAPAPVAATTATKPIQEQL
jgi:hypothetical protein